VLEEESNSYPTFEGILRKRAPLRLDQATRRFFFFLKQRWSGSCCTCRHLTQRRKVAMNGTKKQNPLEGVI
jgi:hypothetical protein